MAEFARVNLAVAPACPQCRQQVTDLDLEALAGGAQHQCLFCGHFMRVPQSILERLVEQEEAALEAQRKDSWWDRFWAFLQGFFAA